MNGGSALATLPIIGTVLSLRAPGLATRLLHNNQANAVRP